MHNELGTGVGVAHFQLFLHGRLHHRIRLQSGGPRSATIHQGPLESTGRCHRHPLHCGHRSRGNEIRFDSNQSHHHSRYASPTDSQRSYPIFFQNYSKRLRSFDLLPYSVETVEDGQRNPILAGHGDASPTASWQSRPFILLAVLHFCCSRSRIVWSTGY